MWQQSKDTENESGRSESKECGTDSHDWREGVCTKCGEYCHHPELELHFEDRQGSGNPLVSVEYCTRCGMAVFVR